MPRKPRPDALGARERQIMDAVYKLGEASVAEVLADLPDPPSYSAVRTMIRATEAKKLLQKRRAGNKYVCRARRSRESAACSAITHLMQTFFGGSAAGTRTSVSPWTPGGGDRGGRSAASRRCAVDGHRLGAIG